jgi:serine phosphatase RsbU (regulator of sigma subunit)
MEIKIKPGSVIAMFSDGYVDGSRQLASLTRFVSARLSTFDGSSESLKELFAQFNAQNTDRPNDDRTLVVVSWKREEAMTKAHHSQVS